MRYSTTSGLVLAAIVGDVVAGPTHAHLHRKVHEKKDVDFAALDWATMDINWSSAYAAGEATKSAAAAAAAAPTAAGSSSSSTAAATTTAVAVAADNLADNKVVAASSSTSTQISSAKSTSTSTSSGSSIVSLWDDLVGLANDLVSFGSATATSGSVVGKIGNIGSPQGSNMIKVDSVEGYDFTNEFINESGESMTVVLWNKAYSTTGDVADALANLGSCVAPKTPALTLALAPGASQIVAFQSETQMGWAQAVSDIAYSGQFATTWGEANFVTSGSGYDVSAIMNSNGNNYNMTISASEVTCISDMTQNMWLTDSDPVGTSDGSCYVPQSTMHLTTIMAGTV